MVKKFEEFISTNEGFWKSGIKRSKENITRLGDIPELSQTSNGIPAYEVDNFPGWFFAIYWNKNNDYEPFVGVYNNEVAGHGILLTFEDTKSNGYQKKFTLASYGFTYQVDQGSELNRVMNQRGIEVAHRMDDISEEFGESVNKMLKRLPDKSFLVDTECVYDVEHKGYPIIGYKKQQYYFDFRPMDFNKKEKLVIKKYDNGKCNTMTIKRKSGFWSAPVLEYDKNIKVRDIITKEQVDIEDGSEFTHKEIEEICSDNFYKALNKSLSKIPNMDRVTALW